VQDKSTLNVEGQQELVRTLSNSAISNDLE